MRFYKYHALGNYYLVREPAEGPFFTAGQIRAICHRNYGLGSDGILEGPLPANDADFGLRIWNPDGSEAEKSGNGLRIFARHLLATGRIGADAFTVETVGGKVTCQVFDGGSAIAVEMGRVAFDAAVIPVSGDSGEVIDRDITLKGRAFRYCAATIGNPHVVVPVEAATPALACEFGPLLENLTERFPNRTNVQFLQPVSDRAIRIEIWERGAGYTLASGSSSSAAAAVAHRLGLCGPSVTVHCPGGDIGIEIGPDYAITMTGPATPVGIFEMDPGVPDQVLPQGI